MADTTEILRKAGVTVAAFALMGLGLGLTGYISIDATANVFMGGQYGGFGYTFVFLVFLQSAFLSWFFGPIVAFTTGLWTGRSASRKTSALASTAGSLVGFVVMVAIAIVLMIVALPESGGGGGGGGGASGQLLDQAGAIALAALPTTVIGGVAGYFSASLDF